MNRLARLLIGAAAIGSALIPSAAVAAPPTLDQVGQANRHITASWSFASGNYASRYVQVASSSEIDEVGFFPTKNQEEFVEVPADATSWRSSSTFSPGTHYVHVLVENLSCPINDYTCETLEWSNVKKVVIPMPAVASPTHLALGHANGRVVARWKLPTGPYTAGPVEVATQRQTKANGEFRDGNVVASDFLQGRVSNWTSAYVGPGTYYVHVAAELNICGENEDRACEPYGWSRIARVVVPESDGPRHFKGRTSQGERIGFTVFDDRVTGIRIGYDFSCLRGTRSGSATLGSAVLSASGAFSDHDDWLFTDGSAGDSWIHGNLHGVHRATGTFRFKTRGGFNGGCSTGHVSWNARA